MKKETVNSYDAYVKFTEKKKDGLILFRGQSSDYSLLPGICRMNSQNDTLETEKKMIEDFKNKLFPKVNISDWQLLTIAQHYGLKTRLLDWSRDPSVALWFACNNDSFDRDKYKDSDSDSDSDGDRYVYVLDTKDILRLTNNEQSDPFKIRKTRIIEPILNNPNIIAQKGYFTAHKYWEGNNKYSAKFVSLENHEKIGKHITEIKINKECINNILNELSRKNITKATIYPPVEVFCEKINTDYSD